MVDQTRRTYDVFLSHNGKQKSWVRRLSTFLKEMGLSVFFDEESIALGASMVSSIDDALSNSRHVVFVVSEHSLSSRWVALEVEIASYNNVVGDSRSLIPVVVDDIGFNAMPGALKIRKFVDLRVEAERERAVRGLLRHLGVMGTDDLSFWRLRPILDVAFDDSETLLRPAGSQELIRNYGDIESVIDELLAIDVELIDGVEKRHLGVTRQWKPVLEDNPHTWRILLDKDGKIGAYWHFVCLFPEERDLVMAGKFDDAMINQGKVAPVGEFSGVYTAYFVAVCMRSKYRNPKNMQLLFESFFDALQVLAENSSFVVEVLTNAFSLSGVRLCRHLRLVKICSHYDCGEVYAGTIETILGNPVSASFPRLRKLYLDEGLLGDVGAQSIRIVG